MSRSYRSRRRGLFSDSRRSTHGEITPPRHEASGGLNGRVHTVTDYERNPALDYNNQAFVSDFLKFFEVWRTESARIRETRPCYLNVPYGNGPKQTLDIFM